MTEANFNIPFGTDKNENLIPVDDAVKGEQYYCIECGSPLMVKQGEIREKHFSHIPNSNCNRETVLHKTAKRLIQDVIKQNFRNESEINLKLNCDSCDKPHTVNIKKGSFSDSKEEVRVGNFVCDVVGYRNNSPSLGIEIFQTHKVDNEKGENLALPWIELNASDVISNPREWSPIKYKLQKNQCLPCKTESKRVEEVCTKWNIDRSLYSTEKKVNQSDYIASTTKCWKCRLVIPVFWWKGVPFAEETPPQPSPWTIRNEYSKAYGGKYYANTCPNCKNVQGDNFVFLKPDSTFSGLPLDTAKSGGGKTSNSYRSVESKEDINDVVNTMFRGFRI